jgi:protein-tyrosine phosphatase
VVNEILRDQAAEHERHIDVPGTRNLRDVGGYPAGAGRRTRWRTLFRSDALDQLPDASIARIGGLGIRTAIDLRWPSELEVAPSVFAASTSIRYVSVELLDNAPAPAGGVMPIYRRMLDERGAEIAAVVAALLEPDTLPAVVGCAAGVDRTGVAIAVILSAVGVPVEVIATDYALSAQSFAGPPVGFAFTDWRNDPVEIDCQPQYMTATLDYLRHRHAGAEALLARHGIGVDAIARLRELLTEPTP